jgi:hypothetical protein
VVEDRDEDTNPSKESGRVLGTVAPIGAGFPPPRPDLVNTWPNLVYKELLAGLLCIVVLMAISLVFDAPLEDPADPIRTPNPAKAPWYFVGLQELLVYFDPWIAGVMIPLLITLGLCAIPYLDPTRHDQGVYTLRRRPLASAIFLTGLIGWFVLIAVGLWFRGPGWAWDWPGPATSAAKTEGTRSVPNAVGVPLVLAYFLGGGWLVVRRTASWPDFTRARRWIFALLLLAMLGTLIKIALRIFLDIRYVVSFQDIGLNL